MNPKKAVIVLWQSHPRRLVFCHEASSDTWMILPGGVGLCNQFLARPGPRLRATGKRRRFALAPSGIYVAASLPIKNSRTDPDKEHPDQKQRVGATPDQGHHDEIEPEFRY
jgi:hypothetical protein